ncbi:MAG: glycoside hydrolase family 13 protein [Bacteroidales bacterium]|jgi:glycosidase|nr:glycoside hydrolase family 13 protein [Bacteroidales bacterium]
MKKCVLPFVIVLALVQMRCNPPAKPVSQSNPPAWSKNAIWYQIFVERFYNGDPSNDPKAENIRSDTSYIVPADWKLSEWTKDWYATSAQEKNWMKKSGKNFGDILQLRRYGGDLQGVIDKLDYLSDLGINAIYLNPVNDAPSLHKYDARSYHHIDVNFGPDPVGDNKLISTETPDDPSTWKWTSADKLFLQLVAEVHKRNMHIIMDYSWNHTGTEFWAFRDLVKNQEKSRYKDWYEIISFDDPATPDNEFSYKGWANVKSLPEIKKVNVTEPCRNGYPYEGNIIEDAKKHIFDVTERWLAPDGDTSKGIDGFRLDVADQVPMGFWRDFNRQVKSIKPEAYLVGEIWWARWPDTMMNPVPYVNEKVFDAVMFYQVYRPAKYFFSKTSVPLDAKQFRDSLLYQWNRLPESYRYGMMNVSATHDSPRLLTCFNNEGKYKYNSKPSDDPSYKTGKPDEETYKRVRLYLMHQFTSVGAPHIWNGDEMGMWGADDPDCRKPLWWHEYAFQPETRTNFQKGVKSYDPVGFNREQFEFYKKLIRIRKENPVLSSGTITFIKANGKALVYRRSDDKNQIFVLFNLDSRNIPIELPENGEYMNLMDESRINGKTISLESLTAMILKKL